MTATLTYNLHEPDEAIYHKCAIHSNDMHAVIFSALQKMSRYIEDCDPHYEETAEAMRRILLDGLEANNINHLFD